MQVHFHANQIHFRTLTRFETEAQRNSEMAYSAETCSYSPHSGERQLGQWKLSLTTMYLSYYNYNTQIYKTYIAKKAAARRLLVFASCKKPKYGAFLKAVFVPLCKKKSIFTQMKVKLMSCPELISSLTLLERPNILTIRSFIYPNFLSICSWNNC